MAQAKPSEQVVAGEQDKIVALEQDVFELERSLAILQLAKASTDEVSHLQQQLIVQQERQDILMNVVFLLVVSLVLMAWKLRALSKQQALFAKEVNS